MKKIAILLLILPLFSCAGEEDDISYETFLSRHNDAVSGTDKIENVRNIYVELEITEPETSSIEAVAGKTVIGHYRATRDGQMRIDIIIDGSRVFTEALSSPTVGWEQNGDTAMAKPTSAQGTAALLKGVHANLYGLHELPALGYKIEWLGSEMLMDIEYWAIDITKLDGTVERQFFDKGTYLKAATVADVALHVDVDPTKKMTATFNSAYQEIDGIMYSVGEDTIDLNTGDVMQNTKMTTVRLNNDFDMGLFKMPQI